MTTTTGLRIRNDLGYMQNQRLRNSLLLRTTRRGTKDKEDDTIRNYFILDRLRGGS